MNEKICGRAGCGKALTAANHSGFCQQHFYDSKSKNKRLSTERPPSKPTAKAKSNGNGAIATLIVSENALDNFWNTRPLEDKARMVQQELGRA